MEHGDREKINQWVDDGPEPSSLVSPTLCQCRICHDEEEEDSTTMESPCACSGTLKFAHRGCIQRWCDEKGSTLCEICLKEFKPGYTLPPKASQLIDVMVTIRGSLEVPRQDYEPRVDPSDDESDYIDPECTPSAERGTSFYRSIALMVTTMLLFWHIIAVVTGDDHYVFALATVLMLRASGILLPFYIVMRMIAAIQRAQWRQRRQLLRHQRARAMANGDEDPEVIHQHGIQIDT